MSTKNYFYSIILLPLVLQCTQTYTATQQQQIVAWTIKSYITVLPIAMVALDIATAPHININRILLAKRCIYGSAITLLLTNGTAWLCKKRSHTTKVVAQVIAYIASYAASFTMLERTGA